MSFYVLNPVHPYLGAAIDLRVFPLAAAHEVGFADIAEAYVFYGDGLWQQGHRMYKKDGVFCYRIQQFTGARLYLRFYLVSSTGEGAFTRGAEHEVTYGRYAHLFDDRKARQVETGTYIPIAAPEAIRALPEQVGRALRQGTESLWLAISAETGSDAGALQALTEVLDSVHRLPNTFLELPASLLAQIPQMPELVGKPWIKAIMLTAFSRAEAEAGVEFAETFEGKTILVAISPRDFLEIPGERHPRLVPVGRSFRGLELALLRGITGAAEELAWLILPECPPELSDFWPEYAAATGVGHCFTGVLSAPTEIPFLARPLVPDLALISPKEYLGEAKLPGGFGLAELLAQLEGQGLLCAVVPEGQPWKARAAVWLADTIAPELLASLAAQRRPVMILTAEEQSEGVKNPAMEFHPWPASPAAFAEVLLEWYCLHTAEHSGWVVIPGTIGGEKR